MPLTCKVTFKSVLKACNKVQVPKIIRWQFKLEPDQVLYVGISGFGRGWAHFYAKMGKDGRIFIPKTILFASSRKMESSAGYLLEISLQPT